jgi:hypothetical protein
MIWGVHTGYENQPPYYVSIPANDLSMYIYAHAHFVYTIAEAFNDIAPGIPHQTKPTA